MRADDPARLWRSRGGAAAGRRTRARSGARYLANKVREAAVPGLDAIRADLSSFIRAEHIERHQAPLLASVYHLIERGRSLPYRTALNTSAASLPVRFAASGPWPPYAFARWETP